MGQYEQQIIANAKAISKIIDDAKKIPELEQLTDNVGTNDKLAIYPNNGTQTKYVEIEKILSNITFPIANSEKEIFTSIDLQTDFVLSSTPLNVDVVLDRVMQELNVDYVLVGDTVTFLEALEADSIVVVRKFYSNSNKESFTATDLQTVFTLNSTPQDVDVVLDRIIQIEGIDYNITDNIVTFTEGLEVDSKVIIRKF